LRFFLFCVFYLKKKTTTITTITTITTTTTNQLQREICTMRAVIIFLLYIFDTNGYRQRVPVGENCYSYATRMALNMPFLKASPITRNPGLASLNRLLVRPFSIDNLLSVVLCDWIFYLDEDTHNLFTVMGTWRVTSCSNSWFGNWQCHQQLQETLLLNEDCFLKSYVATACVWKQDEVEISVCAYIRTDGLDYHFTVFRNNEWTHTTFGSDYTSNKDSSGHNLLEIDPWDIQHGNNRFKFAFCLSQLTPTPVSF